MESSKDVSQESSFVFVHWLSEAIFWYVGDGAQYHSSQQLVPKAPTSSEELKGFVEIPEASFKEIEKKTEYESWKFWNPDFQFLRPLGFAWTSHWIYPLKSFWNVFQMTRVPPKRQGRWCLPKSLPS